MTDPDLEQESKTGDRANAVREAAKAWARLHAEAAEACLGRLTTSATSGVERALLRAAAHDLALLERLEGSEATLAEQIALFVGSGSAKNALMMAAALAELMKLRTEATRRATDLLGAAEAHAARRELSRAAPPGVSRLRKVG